MPTLQLEYNCLCLFVRDEAKSTVHVVMLSTNGHGYHAQARRGSGAPHPANGHAQHLVRLVHPSFPEENHLRPLEGWTLELGPKEEDQFCAETSSLLPPDSPQLTAPDDGAAGPEKEPEKPEVVDLTHLTSNGPDDRGKVADDSLVTGTDISKVVTRFTLHAGRVVELAAQATWKFKGKDIRMAHRVVWEIDDLPDELDWKRLDGGSVSSEVKDPPKKLSDLGDPVSLPGGKSGYRLRIFHTTPEGLPPNETPGALKPKEVAEHFAMVLTGLGIPVSPDLLPHIPEEDDSDEGQEVNCGAVQIKKG